MASVITDAIVLRNADHGESDRMLTLLSPAMGKISVNARGCRKPKARLTNATEVFCAGEYVLFEKLGRYTLTGCTIKNPFYDLRCDYERLTEGARWLEMVETAATYGEGNGLLFALLLKGLTYLNYSQYDYRMVAMTFYSHFCQINGFAPEIYRCGVCGEHVEDPLRFDISGGVVLCEKCSRKGMRLRMRTLEVMRGFAALKFAYIAEINVDDAELDSAMLLMRQYIDAQLTQ